MKLTDFKSHFARPLFRRPFAQVFALAAALTLLVDSLSRESVLRALGTLFTNPLVFLYNMLRKKLLKIWEEKDLEIGL